jgi:hypothetical protein
MYTSNSSAASCSLRLASAIDMELRALSDWYSFSDWKRVTKNVPTTQKAIKGSADLKNLTFGLLTTYVGGLAANRAAALGRIDMSGCRVVVDDSKMQSKSLQKLNGCRRVSGASGSKAHQHLPSVHRTLHCARPLFSAAFD